MYLAMRAGLGSLGAGGRELLSAPLRGVALGERQAGRGLPAALTPRELDVLRLIASGASNKEIADALGTAEATVKNQASSIFMKLGVRDRTRAVLRAIELGVL